MKGASRWLEAGAGVAAANAKAATPISENRFRSANRGARIVSLINPPSDKKDSSGEDYERGPPTDAWLAKKVRTVRND
jgi:hypothetical protein